MTTATIEHRKEAICPPWCEGHSGGYQGWERYDDGQKRHHDSAGTKIANTTTFLGQLEQEDHSLAPSVVTLYLDEIGGFAGTDLTPAQARELAAVLVAAAERAEARG